MNQRSPMPVLQQVALTSIGLGISFFCVGIVGVFISKPLWVVIYLLVVGVGFMMIGAVFLLYHKRKR